MSKQTFLRFALWGVITIGVGGCTILQPQSGTSVILPSSAFFSIDASELKPIQAIAAEQDARTKNCHKGPACEEAYYTRGLVALFENRGNAIVTFQELHTAMPNSRYDAAVMGWLNLLQDNAPVSEHNKALMDQLRQEILRNFAERQDSAATRTMKERERRVAELNR